jgi:hypothetical protein
MNKAFYLSTILAAAMTPRLLGNSATIFGNVVREKDQPALGQTVNVVSTPEDKEGRDSKGSGISKHPDGLYQAFVPNVGNRVTGLWVTCMNEKEVADPNYVPFTEHSRNLSTYQANRLILLPKAKPQFSTAEATQTVEALAMTYELHAWAKLIKLPEASSRLAKDCRSVLQTVNGERASQGVINEVMWTAYRNVTNRLKQAIVLNAAWKLDPETAPNSNPNKQELR